jgi:hypothetical protein
LKTAYPASSDAAKEIPASFETFYRTKYPDIYARQTSAVRSSADALLAIYQRNVFPEMNVQWGVYPNNLGHTDFPGCFRCHDGSHTSADGKTISQDCNACHNILAMDEANPKILTDLGIGEKKSNGDGQ